ncbi:type II secretion system protein F (GspF) [Paenibacillus cellulosilyticus]|uniref:Type II secretion system protein F (GspF) n=1 Tax=Paenibacillus cellulosilyticus TaxID=375489 RepID=A0A2V2YWU7_9BACL|nr:type II secretion system F family protein [Paenibacillus cellulosilyticus]PWW02494.1 type II secretion system protein F (GspF) [Paenibacillus cellulosilyticus]QKS47199.1 type II secretion system F family protein [Paenibacillus cellulosilyticus]
MVNWALLLAVVSGLLWAATVLLVWNKDRGQMDAVGAGQAPRAKSSASMQERWLIDAPLEAARRTGLLTRLQLPLASLHGKLIVLRGSGWQYANTERFAANMIGIGWATWTGGALLAGLAHEQMILGLSALIGILLPVSKLRDPAIQLERRRQNMVLALPDVLSKLMLLVGAGETVQRAIARCVDVQSMEMKARLLQSQRRKPDPSVPELPLQIEWLRMVHALENGDSFASAIEAFSKRCAVQEVSMFATVMLLHYRKGGEQLSLALRELSFSLWEKRKATARMRGEEASSKLLFPMVGIFFLLLIAVGAPAVLMMQT